MENKKPKLTDSVILTILVLLATIFFSIEACSPRKKHVVIHAYKILRAADLDFSDDFPDLRDNFVYVIDNIGGCYKATSNTPLTNFSNVSWTKSPVPEFKEGEVIELEPIEVETTDLESDIQQDIENTPDNFESTDSDSSSDGDSGSDGGGDGGDGGGD